MLHDHDCGDLIYLFNLKGMKVLETLYEDFARKRRDENGNIQMTEAEFKLAFVSGAKYAIAEILKVGPRNIETLKMICINMTDRKQSDLV